MGKSNKGNRTKGNFKPSSSGHSALLLSSNGKPLSGFIGFSGSEKEIASYVPVTGQQAADVPDATVDSDFRMVMRKMLKRDSVTRLKAMQEFGDHCVEKNQDIVKSVLPFWPRLFNKLAVDNDRRIREAAHQANGKLLSKVRRDMAPYLKSIMGVWLMGQCDPHPPAASAAISAFGLFSPTKQADALTFCKDEIFSYFKDNLFEQTVKSMSEPHPTSSEDMENKYCLVISSTLQALKLLITSVESQNGSSIEKDICMIVTENKFWKFAKHKDSMIRGSWYAVITCLCQHMHCVFTSMEKKLSTTVFGSLSESDPVVASHIWEAALVIVIKFEDCWKDIDIHKVVLPQLWSFLEEGGKGNASLLYPCLLPLLSCLPPQMMQEESFLLRFFSCFNHSLKLEKVKSSIKECDAILTSFIECLQFLSCSRLDTQNNSLLEKVFSKEIIPLLETSILSPKDSCVATSKFFPLLGSLIRRIEQISLKRKENNSYANSLNIFWDAMLSITCKMFDLEENDKQNTAMYLQYFYNSFINNLESNVVPEKKKSVRFQEETDENCETEESTIESTIVHKELLSTSILHPSLSKSFYHISKVCQILFERLNIECHMCYIKVLEEIIGASANRSLVEEVIKMLDYDPHCPVQFYQETLEKWVLDEKYDDDNVIACVVDFTFLLCATLNQNEAVSILNVCCKIKSKNLNRVLNKSGKSYENLLFASEWLQSSSCWRKELIKNVNESIENQIIKTQKLNSLPPLLEICFSNDYLIDIIVEKGTLKELICLLKTFAHQILQPDDSDAQYDHAIQHLCSILTHILQTTKDSFWKIEDSLSLVLLLFEQSLVAWSSIYSNHVKNLLFVTWTKAVSAYLSKDQEELSDHSFMSTIISALHSEILNLEDEAQMDHISLHCQKVLEIACDTKIVENSNCFEKFLLAFLPSEDDWIAMESSLHVDLLPIMIRCMIFYPVETNCYEVKPTNQMQRLWLASHVVANCLNLVVLRDGISLQSVFQVHIPHLLWCYLIFVNENIISQVPDNTKMNEYKNDCKTIISALSNDVIESVTENMFAKSLTHGADWAFALKFPINCYPAALNSSWIDILSLSTSKHKYITLKALMAFLSEEQMIIELVQSATVLEQVEVLTNEEFLGNLGIICCILYQKQHLCPESLRDTLTKLLKSRPLDNILSIDSFLFAFALLLTKSTYGQHHWESFIQLQNSLLKKSISSCLEGSPTAVLDLYQSATLFIQLTQGHLNYILPEETYSLMVELFISLLDVSIKEGSKFRFDVVLPFLHQSLLFIPLDKILHLFLGQVNLKKEIQKDAYIYRLMKGLNCHNRSLQLSIHTILHRIMKELSRMLEVADEEDDDDDEEENKLPALLLYLLDSLIYFNDMVESMLQGIKIGDACTILPHTDSYMIAWAYLLVCSIMFQLIASSSEQTRLKYCSHLVERRLLFKLFNNIFCLLPVNPLACLKQVSVENSEEEMDLNQLLSSLDFSADLVIPEDIQALACFVFAFALNKMPASIRCWFNNLDKMSADIVNDFTRKYISSYLCNKEIQAVQENKATFKDMVVQTKIGSREVTATYTIDDRPLELSIRLPDNFPLGRVHCELKSLITQTEWREWLMQLTMLLTHQNGSILNGLQLWKRYLEKKFEGVEECMICFQVLGVSSPALPKISCPICHKKFHNTCLYTWFRTSNKNSCPLCRHEYMMNSR